MNTRSLNSKNYITLKLHSPWWGAYKKFNWEQGVEGYGISTKLVDKALKEHKDILVSTKYNSITITPKKLLLTVNKYNSTYKTKSGLILYVVPRTAFTNYKKNNPIEKKQKNSITE